MPTAASHAPVFILNSPTTDQPPAVLIRDAEIDGAAGRDLLVADGRIAAIGAGLEVPPDAEVVDAAGGALLPGLNDHHLHLAALAAAREAIACGPPAVVDAEQLSDRLRTAAVDHGTGDWLRGIGYHESVAGDIDAAWLDARVDWCPVRIQHRGGRLWILNSRALEQLRPDGDAPLEWHGGHWTGRLFEGDVWLRSRLREVASGAFPDLGPVSHELAGYGITGVTDTTPHNDADALDRFRTARQSGALLQPVLAMGDQSLDGMAAGWRDGVACGARKFHLLESALPDPDETAAAIASSHRKDRNVAFHCVTRTELVFALAALRGAGVRDGDRIEHASVTPPELLPDLAELGLTVVTQPAFVAERGDRYLAEVAAEDQPWLYRLRAFREAGVPLAGSSDAPFGTHNPWAAMQAAVERRTRDSRVLGADEALTPERALALYTAPLTAPGQARGPLRTGESADLCLLRQPWGRARADLASIQVQCTIIGGRLVRVNEAGIDRPL